MAYDWLKDVADEYDVIVIGNIKWDELPIACRYEILKKVKAGTGLVGSIPQGRDEYLGHPARRPQRQPQHLSQPLPCGKAPVRRQRRR